MYRVYNNLSTVLVYQLIRKAMLFELCIICTIVFALWIIGKLLMLFDIVHVPKKRIHIWRHVKHLSSVSIHAILL